MRFSRGFEWAGRGATHLVLGTIEGEGFIEAGGQRFSLRDTDLVVAPAGLPRRYATRSARWKFLAIRMLAQARWAHLPERGMRRLPAHWLRRLLPPVEGMLAEHPLGEAVASHTRPSQQTGERPETTCARAMATASSQPHPSASRGRGQTPSSSTRRSCAIRSKLLTRDPGAEPDAEAVSLASLWSRVADRPRGPWDAADLARALGVSRTSLFRLVKRHHGTTPARVVERLRMGEARRLLLESRHPIEVIADQIGYASAFSFSAAFKRVVGTSPSLFRRAAPAQPRESLACSAWSRAQALARDSRVLG